MYNLLCLTKAQSTPQMTPKPGPSISSLFQSSHEPDLLFQKMPRILRWTFTLPPKSQTT